MASASDSFERANGNIGANWTQVSGSFTVGSSTARQTTIASSYRSAIYTATSPATNNVWVAASMNAADSTLGRGVNVRASSSAVTYYSVMGYGGDAFYLEYLSAGGPTTLDTGGVCTGGTTYYIAVTVSGASLSASRNGTADMSATHSTLTTGGWGFAAYNGSGAGNYIDTWSASDLAGGGPTNVAGRAVFAGISRGDANRHMVDAGRANYAGVARGPENRGAVDAGRTVFTMVARGPGNPAAADAGRAVFTGVTRGDANRAAVDAGRAVFQEVGRGDANRAAVDTGRAVYTMVARGEAARAMVETGRAIFEAVARGAATQPGGDATYTDAGRATYGMTASGTARMAAVEAGRAVFQALARGDANRLMVDGGRGLFSMIASGAATQPGGDDTYIVAGRVIFGMTASGTARMAALDAGRALFGMTADDLARFAAVESGRAVFVMTARGGYLLGSLGDAAYADLLRQAGEAVAESGDDVRQRDAALAVLAAALRAQGDKLR